MAKFISYTLDRALYLETGGTGLIGSAISERTPVLDPAIDLVQASSTGLTLGASAFDIFLKYQGRDLLSDGTRNANGLSGTLFQETMIDEGNAVRYVLSGFEVKASDFFMKSTWESIFSGKDEIYLGPLDDSANASGGNDLVSGRGGNDFLEGGEGIDVALYSGLLNEYVINVAARQVTDNISGRDGIDQLSGFERLQFEDASIALDTAKWDNAGSAYRLYKAAFDREPDDVGLGYWIDVLDDGGSLQLAASGFLISEEFQSLYGANPSNTLFLTKLYNNVLDRDPDQGGLDYWIGKLNSGMSRESALINFSESSENVSNVAALIEHGIQYQPWLG